MSNLLKRVLPLLSLSLAAVLLVILLTVSTSPVGGSYRSIDDRLQYLRDAATALDQRFAAALRNADAGQIDAVAQLAGSLAPQTEQIRKTLEAMWSPAGVLNQLRHGAQQAFNSIDRIPYGLADPQRYDAALLRLEAATALVDGHYDAYLSNGLEFSSRYRQFDAQAGELIRQLREGGRDELADQLFRISNQIRGDVLAGEPARLSRVGLVRDQLERIVGAMSVSERAVGAELLETVPLLVSTRRAMNDGLREMDLAGLHEAITGLEEIATEDHVRALSMISDARVLLNLYTVFLLALLAYLGLRLRSSYTALNRSHDELEERVKERTLDLAAAYEELKESQVQLVQAEKMSSLGQLVAGVMHEINTPLTYVLNNTTITSESIGELNRFVQATLPLLEAHATEDVKGALKALLDQRDAFDTEAIRESIEEVVTLNQESVEGLGQISELVQSLKDFSRLDRATEDRFDVCEGIEKTLNITRNLLKYGIEVEKNFEDVGEIYCSPARINQVFVNLVTNAAQAMDGKGKLSISVHGEDDFVSIDFEDTGCGIEEENLSRIMDPFFTTKPVGQGTGLGLSIVHQIVQQHNGTLEVASEVGKGTCITVRLPRQPVEKAEVA